MKQVTLNEVNGTSFIYIFPFSYERLHTAAASHLRILAPLQYHLHLILLHLHPVILPIFEFLADPFQ